MPLCVTINIRKKKFGLLIAYHQPNLSLTDGIVSVGLLSYKLVCGDKPKRDEIFVVDKNKTFI